MKKLFVLVFMLYISVLFSQVGINTVTPSAASVIDIQSSNDGTNFGGFLPPRVTPAERDLIPVGAGDEGMLVYVLNGSNSQLQIWNGISWQTLFPQTVSFSDVLAAWEVFGVTGYGTSPFDAATSSPSVTVGGLTRGSGLTTTLTAAQNAWGANGWYSTGAPTQDQTAAITSHKYVTFTITPGFGVNLSITTIEPYNIRRTPNGPTTGIWQYSIDGVNYTDIGAPIAWGGDTSALGNPQTAIDLSGIADLQNITSSTTVTFRIVNWGANDQPATTWYINNINGNDLIIRGNMTQ